MKNQLILSIVPRGEGEEIAQAAIRSGAGGGTILLGKGTASNAILQFLGLGETGKDITLSVVPEEKAKSVFSVMKESVSDKPHFGILLLLNVGQFAKSGEETYTKETTAMSNSQKYQLINVIVSRGYAEDAMAAARKAGASGGTILQARGTARQDDAEFFGVQLVPEKEMLLIVVENEKYEAVFNAIHELKCFREKGSGVLYSLPVSDFSLLGMNAEKGEE